MLLLAFLSVGNAQVSFTTQSIPTSGTERAVVDMNGDYLDDIVSVTGTNIQMCKAKHT